MLAGRPVDFPVLTYAATWTARRKDAVPQVVGYGGLCWRFTNPGERRPRCDIWFDLVTPGRIPPVTLVRWARRMLRTAAQMGEPVVYCIRDDEPNSAKLLTLAGLRLAENVTISFADGGERPGEIWQWRPSQQSQPSQP